MQATSHLPGSVYVQVKTKQHQRVKSEPRASVYDLDAITLGMHSRAGSSPYASHRERAKSVIAAPGFGRGDVTPRRKMSLSVRRFRSRSRYATDDEEESVCVLLIDFQCVSTVNYLYSPYKLLMRTLHPRRATRMLNTTSATPLCPARMYGRMTRWTSPRPRSRLLTCRQPLSANQENKCRCEKC